jgi:hypothetical protein
MRIGREVDWEADRGYKWMTRGLRWTLVVGWSPPGFRRSRPARMLKSCAGCRSESERS